jgi:hypothetical protein
MNRYVLLMLAVAFAEVAAANAVAADISSISFKVVVQDDSVLLFESEADVANHDIRRCYNAFVDPKGLKKIRKIMKKGKNPSLNVSVVENYFDRSMWSEATSGHYIYKGRPVQDLCQREDLVVINSVKDD